MKLSERDEMIKMFFHCAFRVVESKGADYEPSGFAFVELRKHAEEIGLTPYQYLLSNMLKHVSSLKSFVKTEGKLQSEDIESRLLDIANYAALFYCLIREDGGIK